MTAQLDLFNPYDEDTQALILSRHFPQGRLWENVYQPDSVIGRFIRACAIEFYRFEVLAELVSQEMDIRQTDELLKEWELSVGLPNECFDTALTYEERRVQIEQIFTRFGGVQTPNDFERVALIFGYDITVKAGSTHGMFPLQFPIMFFSSAKAAGHSILIRINSISTGEQFPLPFPIPFSSGGWKFLSCIFTKLAPANVALFQLKGTP